MRSPLFSAWLAATVALLAASCTNEPAEPPSTTVALTPSQKLVRISMALRGVRPSLYELESVRNDPNVLPDVVDFYLTTPELGATVREMHLEQLLANIDAAIYPAGFPAVDELAGMDVQAINESVIEAPGRLVEHIVMNDRPYHEIVTADYTVADPIVSTVFGIPYDPAGEEWQVTHYDDRRPVAGILSDSYLFTRHSSTFSNKNRGRAAVVARSLLCYDFLSREVELDVNIDLADDEAVANAIRENEACASCHQTLDPLASHFADYFPIYVPSQLETYPFSFYGNPVANLMRVSPPIFFGEPSSDVRDLGILVAEDPRFTTCAVRRFYSHLAQVPVTEVSPEVVARLSDVFLGSGMNARELMRSIVLSDEFLLSHAETDTESETLHGMLKARPEQIARTIEDLTGFRWETRLDVDFGIGRIGRVDLMTDSFFGFEVLAGGTDGQSVARPAFTTSATSVLAIRGLAAQAAEHVVEADFAEPDPTRRRLLTGVEATTTDEPAVRAQLAALELRIFGDDTAPDSAAVNDAWTLFSSVLRDAGGDARRAWAVTLYAMFQDIRLTHY